MTTYDELARRYIDTWNETDPSARSAAVDRLYTEDARYVDPLAVADGRDAIASMIGAVQEQFPGFTFRLAGPVDGHHNQARFGWELVGACRQACQADHFCTSTVTTGPSSAIRWY